MNLMIYKIHTNEFKVQLTLDATSVISERNITRIKGKGLNYTGSIVGGVISSLR